MRRVIRGVVRPLVGLLFRPTLHGAGHLPSEGPYLLVANHSAGMGIAEIASIAALWVERFDRERSLAGFAHPIGFRFWPMRNLMRALGTVPSTYEDAFDTLAAGVPLLVFPGGDHETLRPVWQANCVDFGGRTGFLRIAREAGVPIVPLGIRGSHYTAPMLLRARWLAWVLVIPRAVGLERWGISLLGVLGTIPILLAPLPLLARLVLTVVWLASPLSLLPWVPWTIRLQIGEPLAPEQLFPPHPDQHDDDSLQAALVTVEESVQALVRMDRPPDSTTDYSSAAP